MNEQKLIEQLNFYNNLLNRAEQIAKLGHWQWNIKEDEIIWSNNLYSIFGLEKGLPINFDRYITTIHEDDRLLVQQIVQNALATSIFTEFYHRIVLPSGQIRILHGRGEVICDEAGEPYKMVGTSQDVTEIKLAEQELFLKASELENKNAALKNFAYVASHDLQEPLRKLTLFCSLLKSNYQDKLDSKADEYIDKIVNAALRMRSLIKNILDVSNVSDNIKYDNVDLNVVLNTVLNDLEASIESSNAKITFDTLPIIEANEIQMYQLLQNLITNAIKFRKPGHSPVIEISSFVNGTSNIKESHTIKENTFLKDQLHCILTIKDNGTGFDEKNADKMFTLFQSLHNRSDYKGNGIGLFIVKKIIEAHRGTISVKSQHGLGSTFTISLPLKHATVHPEQLANINKVELT